MPRLCWSRAEAGVCMVQFRALPRTTSGSARMPVMAASRHSTLLVAHRARPGQPRLDNCAPDRRRARPLTLRAGTASRRRGRLKGSTAAAASEPQRISRCTVSEGDRSNAADIDGADSAREQARSRQADHGRRLRVSDVNCDSESPPVPPSTDGITRPSRRLVEPAGARMRCRPPSCGSGPSRGDRPPRGACRAPWPSR